MNREDAIFELLRWDDQESFYRSWHLADEQGRALLLADDSVDAEYKDIVTKPAEIDPLKTEERFFAAGCSVQLIKHPRYLPFFRHSHDFYEILCVLSGSCRHELEGRETTLVAGDLCFIAPGARHGLEVMDDSLVMNVLVRSSTFLDMFLHAVRDKGPVASFFLGSLFGKHASPELVFHTKGDNLARNAVLDMFAEQQEADEVSDRIVCSLLTIFLARLTRTYGESADHTEREEVNPLFGEMVVYALDHAATVTLSSLAQHFHYSQPYCSKMIRETSGLTFSELVTRARLQQAMSLLYETQLSVAQIGAQVGYRSPETFIRAFERKNGMTPTQYRRSRTELEPVQIAPNIN